MTVQPRLAVLSGVTALMLAFSAFVHFDLAGIYAHNAPPNKLSEGAVFQIQASLAVVVALLVLAAPYLPGRLPFLAFAAAASFLLVSFLAVTLSRYGVGGALLFLPDMKEPTWASGTEFIGVYEKLWSAIAELAGAVVAGFAASGLLRTTAAGAVASTRPVPTVA